MCRTVVEQLTPASQEFFVNSTPGGSYDHIRAELDSHQGPIAKLAILAGSNDLKFGIERAAASCMRLLAAIRMKYPATKVYFYN